MKLKRSAGVSPVLLFAIPAIQLPLLLIFFILLGASYLLQPGFSVSLPDSPFVLSPQKSPQVVTVAPPPSSAIYFDNRQTDIEGLREALQPLRGRSQTIVIRADRRVIYDRVVAVMNIVLELGFPVVLATTEEAGLP
jgi:biopolymer transport protein ExbD